MAYSSSIRTCIDDAAPPSMPSMLIKIDQQVFSVKWARTGTSVSVCPCPSFLKKWVSVEVSMNPGNMKRGVKRLMDKNDRPLENAKYILDQRKADWTDPAVPGNAAEYCIKYLGVPRIYLNDLKQFLPQGHALF
jgi:hypothetical protein